MMGQSRAAKPAVLLLSALLIVLIEPKPAVAQQQPSAKGIVCGALTPFHCIAFAPNYDTYVQTSFGENPTNAVLAEAFCNSDRLTRPISVKRRGWPITQLHQATVVDVVCGRPAARPEPQIAARPRDDVRSRRAQAVERLVPIAPPTRAQRRAKRSTPSPAASPETVVAEPQRIVRGYRDDGPPQRFRNRLTTPAREIDAQGGRTTPVGERPAPKPWLRPAPDAGPKPPPDDPSISYEHF